VKWVADRTGGFLSDWMTRDQRCQGELALDEEGRILALRIRQIANTGAFVTPLAIIPPTWNFLRSTQVLYRTPLCHAEVRVAVTNTCPVNIYRGAGQAGRAAEPLGGGVLAGQHGMHARRGAGAGGVDGQDARMRMRRAEQAGEDLARQCDIGGEASLAAQQPVIFPATDRLADTEARGVCGRYALIHGVSSPIFDALCPGARNYLLIIKCETAPSSQVWCAGADLPA
jgi:CO/xanthine dehydrogenase Mo-binding subunit